MGCIGLFWLLNEYFGVFVMLIGVCVAGAGLFYLYEALPPVPVWLQTQIILTLFSVVGVCGLYSTVAGALKRLRHRKKVGVGKL
jgi:uncharacterized membrane protein